MYIEEEHQLRDELNTMILNNTKFHIIEPYIKSKFENWDSNNLKESMLKEYYEKSLSDDEKRIIELEKKTFLCSKITLF